VKKKTISIIENEFRALIKNENFAEAINYFKNNAKEIFRKKNLDSHGKGVINITNNNMHCYLMKSENRIDNLYSAVSLYHDHLTSLQKISISDTDNFKAFQDLIFFNSTLEREFHQLVVNQAQLCSNDRKKTTKQQNLEALNYLNKSIILAKKSTAKREVKISDLEELKQNLENNIKNTTPNQLFFKPGVSDHSLIKSNKRALSDSSFPIKKRKIDYGQNENVIAGNIETIVGYKSPQQSTVQSTILYNQNSDTGVDAHSIGRGRTT
jgi:hypothetical protein